MKKEVKVITVPAKTNSQTFSSPTPIQRLDTIHTSSTNYEVIKIPDPINQELLEKYEKAQDSIVKLNLYKEAITEREYKEVLSDSVQTITVHSKVIGTLTEQIISYTTNPITLEIKSKRSSAEVFLGGFTTIPTMPTGSLDVGGQLSIKTKNQLYNIGYTVNGSVMAGISFKIL